LDVYLENGYHIHKTAYGNGVSIERFEALHKAIGLWLTEQPHPLNGSELRFLRLEMDLTQRNLAGVLGATEQTLWLWEKGRGKAMPGPADRLLRALYLEFATGDGNVRHMVNRLAELDQAPRAAVHLPETGAGWRVGHSQPHASRPRRGRGPADLTMPARRDRPARALFPLRRSQDPQAEMAWAERRLFEQDLWHRDAPGNRGDLAASAQAVIATTPDPVDSLFYLQVRDSQPERAQTFENIILSLIRPRAACRGRPRKQLHRLRRSNRLSRVQVGTIRSNWTRLRRGVRAGSKWC
jgi:putative transcriptional regulator